MRGADSVAGAADESAGDEAAGNPGSRVPSSAESTEVGHIAAIYRYPVRSMRGESLDEVAVSKLGLTGDRAYSVVDAGDNAMASASMDARNWKALLDWRVEYVGEPQPGTRPPPIRLIHREGSRLESDAEGFEDALAEFFARPLAMWAGETGGALACSAVKQRAIQRREAAGTPEMPSIPYASAPLHLLTTASLEASRALHPEGRFEPERFRPNIVVETPPALQGFVEKDWLQCRLAIGAGCRAEFSIFAETERCVLTTLGQFDLPKDPLILRTIAHHNRNQMGVYASVTQPGRIRVGDPVVLRMREAASA